MSIYEIPFRTSKGTKSTLSSYKGQVILVVNVASKCGFTQQYEGLQKLYEKYKGQGFMIIGFPCNQFGGQEPGSDTEIQGFCQLNYGVSFPVEAKIDVNGSDAHPLYEELKSQAPGLLGTRKIKWNFTKFLIGRDGQIVRRFAPVSKPEQLEGAIQEALKANQ